MADFSGTGKTPDEVWNQDLICVHMAPDTVALRMELRPPTCVADLCMAWRWTPLSTRDPRWQEGMKTLIAEGKSNSAAAAAMLTPAMKKRFGVPLAPTHGYCGLAGIPE